MPHQREPHAKPLALTMGDPAGIGPEIILKAWKLHGRLGLPCFAVFGDAGLFEARSKDLKLAVPVEIIASVSEAPDVSPTALAIVHVPLAVTAEAGRSDPANAPATIHAVEEAVGAVAAGAARAVITAPVSKSVLYGSGFAFPGHTEFLAALAARHWPAEQHQPVMMLASDDLRVVPLTIHVPLARVPALITHELIVSTVRITHRALTQRFGFKAPRLAVAGLNPHAGEDGSIGREDADIIAPAVKALQSEGLDVTGPHAADSMFHAAARAGYDAAIAMYHDQALIPIKTLAFDTGVNVTLGLPFVRTSPDHGTAFAIARDGIANPSSLIAALTLADRLTRQHIIAPV